MPDDKDSKENSFEQILNAAAGIAETWNEKTNNWLRENHVTFTQFRAILLLNETESQTLSQLSDALSRTRCTITGLVDRLEGKGLVRRKRSRKDRRLIFVSLTEKGRLLAEELKEKVVPEISQLSDRIMGMMTDSEITALYSALGKLNRSISEIQNGDITMEDGI